MSLSGFSGFAAFNLAGHPRPFYSPVTKEGSNCDTFALVNGLYMNSLGIFRKNRREKGI
jgi:hypothetical protein